jgi:hypothetical protein
MSSGPAVAKTVWTEADFDATDWHDDAIHAVAVEPDRFTIEPSARGFTQYLRRAPVRSSAPWLSMEERGGFSFAREGYGR